MSLLDYPSAKLAWFLYSISCSF